MSRFINFGIFLVKMVQKVIIAYNLEAVKTPLKVTRAIYGYIEHSNSSKYKYERQGILSKIKYEKLSRACIIIDKKHASLIVKELKKLSLKMKVLVVEVKKRQNFR